MNFKLFTLLLFLSIPFSAVFGQVDYYSEIQPILDEYCTACHGGISGIDLSTYEQTMQSTGNLYDTLVVIAESPAESPLVDKLGTNPRYGERMPLNRAPLNPEQVDLIRRWIKEGAVETASGTDPLVVDRSQHYRLLKNFPNPFETQTTFRIRSDRRGEYMLQVYDLSGRRILSRKGRFNVGSTHVTLDMENYSSGLYLYKILLTAPEVEPQSLSGSMQQVR